MLAHHCATAGRDGAQLMTPICRDFGVSEDNDSPYETT